jgi:hypothetical protein
MGVAQLGDLAGTLADEQITLLGHERDAGGVVAAVLQARETGQQHGSRLLMADVADDATHVPVLLEVLVESSRSQL